MLFLVQTPDGGWRPGIGDPTFIGWLTVAAYLYATYRCYKAYQRTRAQEGLSRLTFAWAAMTLLMAALSVNKQLDLQSLVTVIGKALAKQQGWYEQRREYERAFVYGVALATALGISGVLFAMRRHLREFWLAGAGAVFICGFIVMRASSFHHVDGFLGDRGRLFNAVFELGGIAVIAFAATRYFKQRARRKRANRAEVGSGAAARR